MSANQRIEPLRNGAPRRHLRVLLVEDSEADAVLLSKSLQRGGFDVEARRVDTSDALHAALEDAEWDLILADHAMPQFSAPEALELAKSKGLDLPFIIVSGFIEEQTAIAAMRAGAHDYVMKDQLARLVPAVERELREAEVRRAQKRAEDELRRAHEELEERVECRTADLQQANLKLQKVIEERRRLEAELLEIAENERRRIGFDLHDDLGQKLTGVSLMISGLERKLAGEQHPWAGETAKVRELVDRIIHHTHNLAHEFGSLDMRGDDLPGVIRDLTENVRRMFPVTCTCSLRGAIPPVDENVVAQLYKIAQESVSNAIKHGKATEIQVSLHCGGDKLTLTIRNNGQPFSPPANAKSRMGLRIMNYRASTLGATFEIKAGPKNGAVVTCVLPLKTGAKVARQKNPRTETPSREVTASDFPDEMLAQTAGAY